MKQFFQKILSVFMTFVVLFSTMSFTINDHYCGAELVSSSFFIKGDTCGMEVQNSLDEEDCTVQKDNCCSDVVIIVEGQDELKLNYSKTKIAEQIFFAAFIRSYIDLFEGLETNIIPFKDYSPPLLFKDIQALDEVYLI